MEQVIFERSGGALVFADGRASAELAMAGDVPLLLARLGVMKPLVVSGGGLARSSIAEEMAHRGMPLVHFDGFTPNPTAEQVAAGLAMYRANDCDGLLSIGGGSAMDVAKAIKALGGSDDAAPLLDRLTQPEPMMVPHVAMPTTAGTGSEATHFATIYIGGKKYSVAHEALLPEAVILDPSQLATLPQAERASTLMDALCHSIESYWSVRSSEESRAFSAQAIGLLTANAASYLAGDEAAAGAVLVASNFAGRAINLTTTTAAHAMCYQLTAFYGLRHGHAAAVCLPAAWERLLQASEIDGALAERLRGLAQLLSGQSDPQAGLDAFLALRNQADLANDWLPEGDGDLGLLAGSVNVQRLSNFPVALTEEDLAEMYRRAFEGVR